MFYRVEIIEEIIETIFPSEKQIDKMQSDEEIFQEMGLNLPLLLKIELVYFKNRRRTGTQWT